MVEKLPHEILRAIKIHNNPDFLMLEITTVSPTLLMQSLTKIVIQDGHLETDFDSATGAMTRFFVKSTGWNDVNNPALQGGLRIPVPMPDRQPNQFFIWDNARQGLYPGQLKVSKLFFF